MWILAILLLLLLAGGLAYRSRSMRQSRSKLLDQTLSEEQRRTVSAQVPLTNKLPSDLREAFEGKMEKLSKIDEFYCRQLAYFLEQMRNTKDVDGKSLLHNSMIVWGSGLCDADRHSHDDLPIIVAGNAGGKFTPGHHRDLGSDVPLNNLREDA